MIIINATQHVATQDQRLAGVWDIPEHLRKVLVGELSFEDIPSSEEMERRATRVVALLNVAAGTPGGIMISGQEVMIGGAPYFMAPLERALVAAGARPVYAFSRRESVEEPLPGGGVKKVAVFRHAGFVKV